MDVRSARLDTEFNQSLAEMKPYVLRLPHKTERQRCALWIKKLSEPPLTSDDRKNRDLHSKLLLHMLKRGQLDGPFVINPEDGPLKSLPGYMSVFFDNSSSDAHAYEGELRGMKPPPTQGMLPDWVFQELDSTAFASQGSKENVDPNTEDRTMSPGTQQFNLSRSDGHVNLGRSSSEQNLNRYWHPHERTSGFRDETSLIRMHEKEMEMNTKVLQAQFHEEKLKIQHKHDKAVQKILDRKNGEIDDLKQHYKSKEKDFEDAVTKSDKRSQGLLKELQILRDAKEKQVEDLKGVIEETAQATKAEYESKLEEALGTFERDKYELQKAHTKKIQELLDDTNHRLMRMEDEYNAQSTATKMVTSELEVRVSQLTQETESLSIAKQSLQNDKEHTEKFLENAEKALSQMEGKYAKLEKEMRADREDHELQMKSLLSKHDANTEFLKQENTHFLNKAQETARDLENQIQNMKHALQDSEQQRMRELRERESLHQQDITSMQRLHEKQIHQLQCEWDNDKAHHAKEIRSLENIIHDRDEQITKLNAQIRQNTEEAEKALDSYKQHMSESQKKIFEEMQSQIDKVTSDMEESRKQKEKIKHEFEAVVDDMKSKHHDDLNEMRLKCEHDKATITRQAISDRDQLTLTHEKQLDDLEQKMKNCVEEKEHIIEEQKKQNHESMVSMEVQIRELREELVSANALRRTQLVELGLLREEERQKAAREHDGIVNKLEAEIDRQRLTMHQQHATELDKQSLKTKSRLEALEKDYQQRLERAYDRINEMQQKEHGLRDELSKTLAENEQQLTDNIARKDDDAKRLRLQFESKNTSLAVELESEREKFHSIQRQFQKVEYDLKDKVTKVRMEYEERMKGYLPASLKKDMEDTISCLRSQVSSLQQRVSILQEEVDENQHFLGPSLDKPRLTTTELS